MAMIDGDSGNITKCMPEESECEDGYHQRIRTWEEGGPMVGKLVSAEPIIRHKQYNCVIECNPRIALFLNLLAFISVAQDGQDENPAMKKVLVNLSTNHF